MSQFDNVSVDVAANFYFEGKVTSRNVHFADGSRKTLGVMLPGEFTFGTSQHELMEITAGKLEVKLPGQDWQTVGAGGSFTIEANASFDVKVIEPVDYCCSYS